MPRSVFQYEQPRCPDNWNEAERRFYNRLIETLDDIYSKYGRLDEKMLSKGVLNRIDNSTATSLEKMTADILSSGKIAADSIEATFAYLVSLSAKYGSFDFETVKNLVADAMVLEKGQADYVHITNLAATYAQAVNAIIGNLVIQSSDGKYYQLDVSADGKVSAKETTVTDGEIAAGETSGGKVIVGTHITAETLGTATLAATQALINMIDASRINVDTLVAREEFVQTLTANEAFVDSLVANTAFIKQLGTTAIVNDKSIIMIAGEASDAKNMASSASSAAANAQSTADSATATANAASQTASNAQTTADEAKNTADSANVTAGNAKATADGASKTATDAKNAASTAQSTADTANSTANSAKTAAANAQSKADSASTAAAKAQSTADTANTTANSAKNTADTANTTANTAKTAAATAQTTANDALAKSVYDGAEAPSSPNVGKLWLDRSVTPCVLRRWMGTDWETVNDMSMLEEVQSALLTKQAELEAAQRESALFLKLDAVNKVVRIGQEKVTSEFLIDAFGSGVSVNNEIFSRFEANRVVFGNMEMRKPAVGGLAFDSIKT